MGSGKGLEGTEEKQSAEPSFADGWIGLGRQPHRCHSPCPCPANGALLLLLPLSKLEVIQEPRATPGRTGHISGAILSS